MEGQPAFPRSNNDAPRQFRPVHVPNSVSASDEATELFVRQLPALPRSFYDRPVQEVARALLGQWLLRDTEAGLMAGKIVEVEAYLAEHDPANHAYRGRTRRNASMFGPPGHAYVYAIHNRFCLNVVTEPEGVPSAVLIRAIEPICGIGLMQQHRGVTELRELARGPGRLCQALAIDRRFDGWDVTLGQQLWLAQAREVVPAARIRVSPRIGVTAARDLPLRYFLADSPYVSSTRRGRQISPDVSL
jgi:DNA-3-methyladenine glycosylase